MTVLTAKLLRSMWGRFLHGVASGEPSNRAIVLWTRLTPTKDAKDAEVCSSGLLEAFLKPSTVVPKETSS